MYTRAHTHKIIQGLMCACVFVSHSNAHALARTVHVPHYTTHNIDNRTIYTCTHADSCMDIHTHIHNMGNRFQIGEYCR